MAGDDGDDELVDGASDLAAVASMWLARSSQPRRRAGKEEVRLAVVELGRC